MELDFMTQMIILLYNDGFSIKEICKYTKKSAEYVNLILGNPNINKKEEAS